MGRDAMTDNPTPQQCPFCEGVGPFRRHAPPGNLVARCPRGQPSTRTAWAHGALAVPELPTDPHRYAATLGSLAPTDDAGPGAVDCVAVGAGPADQSLRRPQAWMTRHSQIGLHLLDKCRGGHLDHQPAQAMPSSSIASFARPDRYALMAALALLASPGGIRLAAL